MTAKFASFVVIFGMFSSRLSLVIVDLEPYIRHAASGAIHAHSLQVLVSLKSDSRGRSRQWREIGVKFDTESAHLLEPREQCRSVIHSTRTLLSFVYTIPSDMHFGVCGMHPYPDHLSSALQWACPPAKFQRLEQRISTRSAAGAGLPVDLHLIIWVS